jgi:hypothetical protein
MWVVELLILAAAIGTAVYSYYQTRELQNRHGEAGRVLVPTVGEGVPWKVVFGDCEISDAHVIWWGNARTVWWDFIHNHLYYISIQLGICHGKLDEILELTYGDVPVGSFPVGFTADGACNMLFLNFPKAWLQGLPDDAITFVLDSVWWRASVTMGAVNTAGTVDPGDHSYVGDQFGLDQYPRHYGLATMTLEDVLIGTNPYLSTLSMRVRRIHWRNGGADAQWYDEKAEVPSYGKGREDFWKYKVFWPGTETMPAITLPDYDDSEWSVGRGGFGNNRMGSPTDWRGAAWNAPTYPVPRVLTQLPGTDATTNTPAQGDAGTFFVHELSGYGAQLWLRADLGALPAVDIPVQCWHDDNPILFFNGTQIPLTATETASDAAYSHFNSTGAIPANLIETDGPNVIAYGVMDSWTWPDENDESSRNGLPILIYAGISVGIDGEQRMSRKNMNPIHAIRECYTDTIWGKRLPDAKMGDTWTAAADTCYSERLGICMVWDGGDVDQLISELLRHVSGVTYKDPVTGKIEIKLLRDDYTVGDLPVFDDTNVVRVADVKNKTTGALVNKLTVGFSATPGGSTASITVQDDGLIDLQGGIKPGTVEYKGFTDAISAGRAAWRDLQITAGPYRVCTVYTNRDGAELRPGDLFVLNKIELGLSNAVMRVNDIELGDGIKDECRITCVDDVFALPAISPIGPGGPISHPPPGRTPGLALDNVSFWTTLMFDPRNEGMVECCYLTTYFEASNWVQTSPGCLEWDLDESMPVWQLGFDGVEPDVYAEGGSPMIGATVFIGEGAPSSATRVLAGPWVIENLGGHWENYGTESQTWVWEKARLHRHPSYSSSSAFFYGMTFQIRQGAHALQYFRLMSQFPILDYSEQSWTEIDVGDIDWLDLPMLLSQSELATWQCQANPGIAVVADDVSGSVDLKTFWTLYSPYGNSPGVAAIGAGTWRIAIAPGTYAANISGESVGSVTRLTFTFYRNSVSGSPIAMLTSDPMSEEADPSIPYRLAVPDVVLGEIPMMTYPGITDTLVMVLGVTTNSTSPITVTVRYNAANAIKVSIPRGVVPSVLGPEDESLFAVALSPEGYLAGFGKHRRLRVIGTGPMTAIESVGITGNPTLLCVFDSPITLVHDQGSLPDSMSALYMSVPAEGESGSIGTSQAYSTAQFTLHPTLAKWLCTGKWDPSP